MENTHMQNIISNFDTMDSRHFLIWFKRSKQWMLENEAKQIIAAKLEAQQTPNVVLSITSDTPGVTITQLIANSPASEDDKFAVFANGYDEHNIDGLVQHSNHLSSLEKARTFQKHCKNIVTHIYKFVE